MKTEPKHTVTKEKLDQFPIPDGACVVVYDIARRKALFYRKLKSGYKIFHTRNKRAQPISIRQDDYALTLDFDGNLSAGDWKGAFIRSISN